MKHLCLSLAIKSNKWNCIVFIRYCEKHLWLFLWSVAMKLYCHSCINYFLLIFRNNFSFIRAENTFWFIPFLECFRNELTTASWLNEIFRNFQWTRRVAKSLIFSPFYLHYFFSSCKINCVCLSAKTNFNRYTYIPFSWN